MNGKRFMLAFAVALLCARGLGAGERLRLPEATPVHVRLKAELRGDQAKEGDRVDFEVAQPVLVRDLVVIPEGAVAWGAIQSAKKGQIKFDIEGVVLSNQTGVKLRTTAEKPKKASKDQVKYDTKVDETAVAPKGAEFVAYVDQDVDLEGASPSASNSPKPGPATTPIPAVENPSANPETPKPAPAPPAVTDVPRPNPAPATPGPTVAPASVERATVECYSDPTGADILIDGNFVGNTPSILKVPVGRHRIEFQMRDFKETSQSLDLTSSRGMRTVRVTLESSE